MRRHWSPRPLLHTASLLVAALSIVLSLGMKAGHACTACYRSMDWQVTHSSLILLGRIEAVEELPRLPDEDPPAPEAGPAIATVRVLQVLKGAPPGETIEVRSGPVRTCALFGNDYFRFVVGNAQVFMFTLEPTDGIYDLYYHSDMLPATRLEATRQRMARAEAYRVRFLEHLAQENPDDAARARTLLEELAASAPSPPDESASSGPPLRARRPEERFARDRRHEDPAFMRARDDLITRLEAAPLRSVLGALAHAWLRDDLQGWEHRGLLSSALSTLGRLRGEEVRSLCRQEWRRLLREAGVTESYVEDFLAQPEPGTGLERDFGFPLPLPDPQGLQGDLMATAMLLLAESDDVGRLVFYALGNAGAQVDPERIQALVPRLLGSDDDSLLVVGRNLIADRPTPVFVPEVARAAVLESRTDILWRLVRERPADSETERARARAWLDALWEYLTRAYGERGQMSLLRQLQAEDLFPSRAIARALDVLESAEDSTETSRNRSEAIRTFLDAATAARQGSGDEGPQRTAEEYRDLLGLPPPAASER